MPATDQQMQAYCDTRLRVRAEELRAAILGLRDDIAAITDVYDRALNGPAWNDARTDGPPSLLEGQDILVYNAVANILVKCIDGTATLQEVSDLNANWPVFQSACVRPVSG